MSRSIGIVKSLVMDAFMLSHNKNCHISESYSIRYMCTINGLSSLCSICLQCFSEFTRAVRCRWCCSPQWFGSGMACLSLHPQTMSRTKSFRKPRSTSKVSPRNSASSPTAAHSRLGHIMSSKSFGIFILDSQSQ